MKKQTTSFLAGFTAATLVFGGGAALAAGITAEPSRQSIYVDGKRVDMEAYAIGGHNYVQLRDVGRAVNFGVSYDKTTDSVQIDSSAPYTEEAAPAPTPSQAPEGVVVIPQSDERFILQEGDKVLCDDGSIYEIKDMSRFDNSLFRLEPLPPLPEPTCDWSQFPEQELPKVEVRRFTDDKGDDLFILNLYETRRMQYTLYNLIGSNPETSDNGVLKRQPGGTPYGRVLLTLDETWTADSFWPWQDDSLDALFNSRPVSEFRIQAWDRYTNGIYQYTEYMIQSF